MNTANQRIAVYGASGYTGKLIVAELARRNIDVVLVGRDDDRLKQAAERSGLPATRIRVAGLDDSAVLAKAFEDCAVVVNCVAPFTTYGEPVLRAAIEAGAHYVDISGEQLYIERVFEGYADLAEQAGVTVVPMVNDGGFLADLVAGLAARGLGPIDSITLAHHSVGSAISRGSARTALANLDQFRSGAAGLPEVATIPRHVSVRRIAGGLDPDLLAALSPDALERIASLPTAGPDADQRAAVRFSLVVDVLADDGRRLTGEVSGADTYGTTAFVAVEAASRLATGEAKPGVLAPSQAFDAVGLLAALAPYGVAWNVS